MRKQGQSDREVKEGWHRQVPDAKAINVKSVSQIGQSLGDHITGHKKVLNDVAQPLHAGRGYNSPLGDRETPGVGVNRDLYTQGSQGKR